MASTGLYGSLRPSPLASTPYASQLEGRNCIQPTAPALETLRLVPKPVSILLIEASTSQGMPYSAPQAWYIGSRKGGISKLSMTKFGTPIGAGPKGAIVVVGLPSVGLPPAVKPEPPSLGPPSGWGPPPVALGARRPPPRETPPLPLPRSSLWTTPPASPPPPSPPIELPWWTPPSSRPPGAGVAGAAGVASGASLASVGEEQSG